MNCPICFKSDCRNLFCRKVMRLLHNRRRIHLEYERINKRYTDDSYYRKYKKKFDSLWKEWDSIDQQIYNLVGEDTYEKTMHLP